MKRGEIWIGAGPNDVSKPRPVVIIQDDAYADLNSVTVVPVSSVVIEATPLRVLLTPSAPNGLRAPSVAMVDKVSTVERVQLAQRIGTVSSAELRAIEQALVVFLGLARSSRTTA